MTSASLRIEFGYSPVAYDFTVDDITVMTLPGLSEKETAIKESGGVEDGWIYAPSQKVFNLDGEEREAPYPSRIFGLPKTHSLSHATATDTEQLSFLVWMFGFLSGMRLTGTEAGFVDATPIEPGKLHDIVWLGHGEQRALGFVDAFWRKHGARISKRLTGVVHALFISQSPLLLSFEKFLYIYTAIDGCHAVWSLMNGRNPLSLRHRQRLGTLCAELKTCTPTWIDDVVDARNDVMHEALFSGEPLGFAVLGEDDPPACRTGNIVLELASLVSRFLCAMLSLPCPDYIKSPFDTRQMIGVTLDG